MNTPTKITLSRIIAIVIMIVGLITLDIIGAINGQLLLPLRTTIGVAHINVVGLALCIIFILAASTDALDGYLARKNNQVTDLGKFLDPVADKLLVNSVLIILACQGLIHPIIPVIIVGRDTIVDIIKMIVGSKKAVVAAIKSGKFKTMFMMFGISLTLFNNLPFELINIKVSDVLLIVATVLSIYSGIQYYQMNKKVLLG